MAIHGISAKVSEVYICKDDPSRTVEDGATGFYPGVIPNLIVTRIKDEIQTASMSYGDMQTQTFSQRNSRKNRECFRFGMGAGRAWDNFFTPEGSPIPFETTMHMEGGQTYTVIAEHVMNMIHSNTIDEVGNEIWNRNNLTESQRKNFEALSSRFGGSNTSDATTALNQSGSNGGATDQQSEREDIDMSDLPPGAAILAQPDQAAKMATTTAPIVTGATPAPGNGKTGAPDV